LKKEWYQRNKKERVDRQRNYRTNNKESIKISNKRYATDNPEKIKQNHDNQYFDGMRIKALKRDKFACQVCGMTEEEHLKKWNYSLTVHHKDGNLLNNKLTNLQLTTQKEHIQIHYKNMNIKNLQFEFKVYTTYECSPMFIYIIGNGGIIYGNS